MSRLPDVAQAICEQQGWDDQSLCVILLRFIEHESAYEAPVGTTWESRINAFFEAAAAEENTDQDPDGVQYHVRMTYSTYADLPEEAVVLALDMAAEGNVYIEVFEDTDKSSYEEYEPYEFLDRRPVT